MLEWIRQKFSKEHSEGLQPLTPDIYTEENKYYVDELGRAVNNNNINTIALMGSYGSGKSSIIKQLSEAKLKSGRLFFKHKLRIKTISFFSLSSKTLGDEKGNSGQAKTIFLKNEILRQLFYQTSPAKVPRIPYDTLENRLPKKVVIPVAAVLAVVSVLFLPIASLLHLVFCDLSLEINFCGIARQNLVLIVCRAILFTILCMFYYCALQALYKVINKYSLKGMGGKVYNLEFIAKNKNFDEFIDGLVYLISRCKYDILIFEDIDRCDDAEIYYALHQLNLALNGRLKKKIKFLFALRDDLIVNLADRAKLFDIIITIVPFLSPENSVDFIEAQLDKAGYETKQIHGIAKIIGRHVTDGRSIISICNTARTMRQQLQKGTRRLDDAKIVAMALIRETNPKDFLGLYDHTGAINNIFSLCQKARASEIAALPSQCSVTNIIKKEQEQFKGKLLSHSQTALHSFSSLVFMGQTYEASPDNCVELLIAVAQYIVSDNYSQDMQISIPSYNHHTVSVVEFFDLLPSSERVLYLLEKGEKAVLEEERRQLLQKDTFTWSKNVEISGEIPSELVFELIELGYLDESYHLYMAPFKQTSASLKVENFKFNNLKVGSPDYYTDFTEIEIGDLLGDLDSAELRTDALYNCSIFDYLAQNNETDVAKNIINVDPAQRDNLFEFYSLYFQQHQLEMEVIKERAMSDLAKENHALWLLSILASIHPEATIEYILNDENLLPANKSVMMSVTLLCLGKPAIETFVCDAEDLNKLQCDFIVAAGLGVELVKLFQANNVTICNIEPFINSPDAMERILKSGKVGINAKNLQCLQDSQILQYISRDDIHIKGSDLMELLNISNTNGKTIDYVMHHLTNYDIEDNKILWEKIEGILNAHHISFSFEEINSINDAPVSVLIAMMAWSQLEKNQVLSLFRKMDEDSGWRKLSVPKSRPIIKDSGIATRQMIAYLRTIGIVSSFKRQGNSYKVICQDFDPIPNP